MILLAAVFFAAMTAGLAGFAFIPRKSTLSAQLEAIQSGIAIAPRSSRFAAVEKLLGGAEGSDMQKKLMEAGWYTTTASQVVTRVAIGFACGLVVGLLPVLFVRPFTPFLLVLPLTPALMGTYVPFFLMNRAIAQRKREVQGSLPDFLDMVAATVQAGVSLNAALGYAVPVAPGALGSEVKEALAQVRLGRSQGEALRAVAARVNQPQFTATVSAITQAEKLGANISQVLNELAEDVRNQRIMRVEEKATQLPTKMVFPMALFLLPALFSVIFGALAAQMIPQWMHQ